MCAEEHILIIEDEAVVRLHIRQTLETTGYSVLEGIDGVEGLELFRSYQDQIVLVFLDLKMPNMSGYEVLAEMQIIDSDVKIVVITGYIPDEELLPGVEAILRKPLETDELLQVVQEALKEG